MPAHSRPPGRPASRSGRSARVRRGRPRRRAGSRRRRNCVASMRGIGPSVPTIWPATSGIGELRSGPCASGVAVVGQQRPRAARASSPGAAARRQAAPGTGPAERGGCARSSRRRSEAPAASRSASPRLACAPASGRRSCWRRRWSRACGASRSPSPAPPFRAARRRTAPRTSAAARSIQQPVHLRVVAVLPSDTYCATRLRSSRPGCVARHDSRRERERGDRRDRRAAGQQTPRRLLSRGSLRSRHRYPAVCQLSNGR